MGIRIGRMDSNLESKWDSGSFPRDPKSRESILFTDCRALKGVLVIV